MGSPKKLFSAVLIMHTSDYLRYIGRKQTVTHLPTPKIALPSSVRSAPSLLQFRRDFKTALHVSVIVLFTIVSSSMTDCNF